MSVLSRRPWASVLVLLCALVAPVLVAGPAAAVTGSVSGTVTDRDGDPVPGVEVIVDDRLGSGEWTVVTDADGEYVADGLPAGRYSVCFLLPREDALAGECWEDVEEWAAQSGTSLVLGEGEQRAGVDAELWAAIHLRGTVTDEAGRPVEGVRVSAAWTRPGDPDNWVSCCDSDQTASDGTYDIGPLYSGDYRVTFSDRGLDRYRTQQWNGGEWFSVGRGEVVDGIDARLEDLARVTGVVTGPDGRAAEGATVRVLEVTPSGATIERRTVRLASDGGYDTGGLQPGRYRLRFDAAPGLLRSEGVTLDVAADPLVRDAELALAPAVRNTRRPILVGHPHVSERLTVRPGTWDVDYDRLDYRWYADGERLRGADGRRMLVTPSMRGSRISVRVTATAAEAERSPGTATTRRTAEVTPH